MNELCLIIEGKASPSGSKKAFVNKYTGRVSVVDTAKGKDNWQAWVKLKATEAAKNLMIKPNLSGYQVGVKFYFRRPQSHYRSGKNAHILRDSAPLMHTQKPDGTKLFRCLEDALKGVCWVDDSQVVTQLVQKMWHEARDFVEITILELPSGGNNEGRRGSANQDSSREAVQTRKPIFAGSSDSGGL